MNYKKIIKSQDLRFKILKALNFIPDSLMIKLQYKIKLGRSLNINDPKRYSEKLQWYKLNYRNPIMTKCADKYEVREYIKSKGLGCILNKLYLVCDSPNDIDLHLLPEKFVIKTTNGSGTNILCKNIDEFDIIESKKKLTNWLSRDYYSPGREWAYKDIKPRIIIEEYLEDQENRFDGINDYKFICFNGKVKYIVFDVDRQIGHKRNIYDKEWNFIDVSTDKPNIGDIIQKPKGLNQMIRVAEKLAEDFPTVRVDLYWVNNKIYFGELTFYPWTGYVSFKPDEFDFEIGNHFDLSKINIGG